MAAAAYLGLIFFIAFTEIMRKKKHKFDFLLYFNIMFCLMYPFPAFLLGANLGGKVSEHELGVKLNVNDVQMLMAIFLGYLFIIIGFRFQSNQKREKVLKIEWHDDKIIKRIALFLVFFSGIAIHIYTLPFGGAINAMSQATYIRENVAEEVGAFAFFQHFMFLSYLGSYLLASFIFFKHPKKNNLFLQTAFVVSLINSIIAATVTGGRAHLIFYGLMFYLNYILINKKIPWTFTIALLIPSGLFVLYGKAFFFSLSAMKDGLGAVGQVFLEGVETKSQNGSMFDELISNFSYTLYSLKAALYTEYPLRLFADWIYAVISFLPERLLNIDGLPDTISPLNTEYILGTSNNSFGIPPALLAFGIYNLSWCGLIIVCFSYGWIGSYLEMIINRHIYDKPWMPFVYAIASQMWIDYYTSGDPQIFFFADFWSLAGMLILFGFGSKISLVKYHNRSSKFTY